MFEAFWGALFAFLFAGLAYNFQRKKETLAYMKYCIASMNSNVNDLYNLKKYHLSNIQQESAELDKLDAGKAQVVFRTLLDTNYDLEITTEQLSFIAQYNPNIISLLCNTVKSCRVLTNSIIECNEKVEIARYEMSRENITVLIAVHKALIRQAESTHYLLEKSCEVLSEVCKYMFNEKKYVNGLQLTQEESDLYKPKPIESYELEDWTPKLSIIEKIRMFFFV